MTTSTYTHKYLIGVDGGGSGTRVVLADAQGVELARATGGPSGLGLGVERAWDAIEAACSRAFEQRACRSSGAHVRLAVASPA